MFKKVASIALLVTMGTLSGLALCEVVLRLFYPQGKKSVGRVFFMRHDPLYGWVNRPHSEGVLSYGGGNSSRVRINSHGARGEEFPMEKPSGARRIVAIGDSVTFGYGVEEEETFLHLLDESLPDPYQIINMGVMGYGTDQELLLLEREALKYSPDFVLVGYSTSNDIYDTMSAVRFGIPKPFFKVRGEDLLLSNVPVPEPKMGEIGGEGIARVLIDSSHLYRFLAYRLWLSPSPKKGKSDAAMSFEEGWDVTESIIKRMNSLCNKAGCRLLFVVMPDGHLMEALESMSVMTGDAGIRNRLIEILKRNGILYIDLWTPFLDEQRRGERLFIEGDPDHWNPVGNRLAAKMISGWMREMTE